MPIYHVLRDGTRVKDVTGHVVKLEDARNIYSLMETMNQTHRKCKRAGKDFEVDRKEDF